MVAGDECFADDNLHYGITGGSILGINNLIWAICWETYQVDVNREYA